MKEALEDHWVINKIFTIRERKVMLDADLAELYDVTSKRLNEQVKRNLDRFPGDFMFQLSDQEFDNLRSQNATSSHGGRRYNPYVFTEHGVLMLSSVLRSKRAIEVIILIMRVFIKMRRNLELQNDLLKRIDQIANKVSGHDQQINRLFLYVQSLSKDNQTRARPKIGYKK